MSLKTPQTSITGFTLVELLVVLVLVGLALSLTGASLIRTHDRVRAVAEVQQLQNLVAFMSMHAFTRGRAHTLHLAEAQAYIVESEESIDFEFIRFSRQTITWNAHGFSDEASVEYVLQDRIITLAL